VILPRMPSGRVEPDFVFMQTAYLPRVPAWSPHGFEEYRRVFPMSPDLASAPDHTEHFISTWRMMHQNNGAPGELRAQAAGLKVVFVRGLFGRWIPRHFTAPLRLLQRHGVDCMIANSKASGTVETNASLIERDLATRVAADSRLIFLCHSKGGLDILAMLEASAALRSRTHAIVLCQTPRGGCAILESVLNREHQDGMTPLDRFKERIANASISALRAKPACEQLTGGAIRDRLIGLESAARDITTIAVASWSREPTAWLDSQHERLGRIRPGCAHDGLFYTEDLIWPASRQVLLPCIDHSQPAVGGHGFEHGRFWLTLAHMALER
jgi:hypothetical protein